MAENDIRVTVSMGREFHEAFMIECVKNQKKMQHVLLDAADKYVKDSKRKRNK